ncbi:MAG: hypothetical protein GX552_03480 [Chloroflexi bacterium]|jgi:hypothetical protein|nr:hypothetical protein [Chloroflexota bacterium]
MKKLPAILAVIASIPFFTLGILFLIAALNQPSRILVALVLLAVGAFLLVAGLRRLRRLADISPEALQTNAVELARRLGGELTVAQLRAEYRISNELASDTLEELVAKGTATREQREDRVVYVVSGLAPSLSEKVCPYCGTELPVRTALRKCPNCGGQLEIRKS